MGLFNRFPYTNFHALNLDWLINKFKDLANSIPTKVSQLENDSGYITSAQSGAVDSVNGMTGAVVLDADDVGALPDNYTAPVASVNGMTGAVVLDADDVGALPDNYTAPVASINGMTGAVVLDADDVGALADDALTPTTAANMNLANIAEGVTIRAQSYSISGNTVTIKLTLNVTTALSNGDIIGTTDAFKIKIGGIICLGRSASTGNLATVEATVTSTGTQFSASGAIAVGDWIGFVITTLIQ